MQSPEEDTIRILVATDNHVGYAERDPVRGDDSANTFDEIMSLATERVVDMVLLAGDLFHDNKPSRKAMFQVMRSLRLNCYGDKPCELQILSDLTKSSDIYMGAFSHANYEDSDINVAIPVFSIHGNHDDPTGDGRLCALDLLQVAGLVNYFGRARENDSISITPILLQKGSSKLALYGLSNVRDERLFRTFQEGKVTFLRPENRQNEYFSLMCVHQNRYSHTQKGYLPENFLQNFLDLVVWGHEHECLIDPRHNDEQDFYVMQPGSSVATSLCDGEAKEKQVAILSIHKKEFHVEPVVLKSVRPFIMRDISLAQELKTQKLDDRVAVTKYLSKIVDEAIKDAKEQWQARHESSTELTPPLPLVRIRVDFSGPNAGGGNYTVENPQRFSNRFVGRVANSNDVVQFYLKKKQTRRKEVHIERPDADQLQGTFDEVIKVEDLVRQFLSMQTMEVLPENGLAGAMSSFVDKDDRMALKNFVETSLDSHMKYLLASGSSTDDALKEAMSKAKLEQASSHASHAAALSSSRASTTSRPPTNARGEAWDSDFDGEEVQLTTKAKSISTSSAEISQLSPQPAKSKKPAPASRINSTVSKATTKTASKSKSTHTTRKKVDEMDDDSIEEEAPPTKRKAASRVAPKTTRQSRLEFASSQATRSSKRPSPPARRAAPRRQSPSSEDDIDDDDFEPLE